VTQVELRDIDANGVQRRRSAARRMTRPLTDDQLRILLRIARLRAVTGPQAHALVEVLTRGSLQNAYARLATLVRNRFLVTEPTWPDRGCFSAYHYRLASAGLLAIHRDRDRNLLARPSQWILEYLLFRNEVYATARRGGWFIASPLLTREDLHPMALDTFRQWAIRAKEREVHELRAAGRPENEVARAAQDLERLPRFLPQTFDFEYLMKRADGRVTDLVLLVIDDPRRAIQRPKGLASHLPHVERERVLQVNGRSVTLPGLRLLLRDAQSVYDLGQRKLFRPSPRLRAWRRVLAEQYGREFLATDTLFPDLWARRVQPPAASSPRGERSRAWLTP